MEAEAGMMENKAKKKKFTSVSKLHFVRLGYRSLLFLACLVFYVIYRLDLNVGVSYEMGLHPMVLGAVWIVYMVEMFIRFFPSRWESPGSQKQFERNYIKTGETQIDVPDNNGTMLAALAWVCLNAPIGALHMAGVLDDGIMILLSCAYGVCDMICILFFCPFQSWILKNKCCGSCRIYNWDYAMMFTPLLFVGGLWSWSLLALSLGLLLRWEISYHFHPERFYEETNCSLSCAQCREKLCSHKRSLQGFLKKRAAQLGNIRKMWD